MLGGIKDNQFSPFSQVKNVGKTITEKALGLNKTELRELTLGSLSVAGFGALMAQVSFIGLDKGAEYGRDLGRIFDQPRGIDTTGKVAGQARGIFKQAGRVIGGMVSSLFLPVGVLGVCIARLAQPTKANLPKKLNSSNLSSAPLSSSPASSIRQSVRINSILQSNLINASEEEIESDNGNESPSIKAMTNHGTPDEGEAPAIEGRDDEPSAEAQPTSTQTQTARSPLGPKHEYKSIAFSQERIRANETKVFIEKKDLSSNETIKKSYIISKELGQGSFGTAFELREIDEHGKEISLTKKKVLKVPHDYKADLEFAKGEITKGMAVGKEQMVHPETGAILAKVPGIMKRYKAQETHSGAAIATHYGKGDLEIPFGKEIPPPPIKEMFKAFGDLTFGLAHLHRNTDNKPGRIHRDIKGANILRREVTVEKNGIKTTVTEYGLADTDGATKYNELHKKMVSTPFYVGKRDQNQEQMIRAKGTEEEKIIFYQKGDIRALGITLREFITGKSAGLFCNVDNGSLNSPLSLNELIENSSYSDQEIQQLEGLCNLVNKMTEGNWRYRPSAEEVVQTLKELGIPVPEYSN